MANGTDVQMAELRSEEVQEVMGQIPSWIVRWGIGVLFLALLILLVGCYFFRYPDRVRTEMTLSSVRPVVEAVARQSGRLGEWYATEGQRVEAGVPLAVLENAARAEDVFQLKRTLQRWAQEPERLESVLSPEVWRLGSIQPAYTALLAKHPGERDYRAAVGALWTALREWEMAYCIEAPVAGKVALPRQSSPHLYLSAGQCLARILPDEPGEWVGLAQISLADAGKVRVGQRAVVRFTAFPDQLYGWVEGRVRSVAPLPWEERYRVEIIFPKGMVTQQGKELPLRQGMQAMVEVVTDERRLIELLLPLSGE